MIGIPRSLLYGWCPVSVLLCHIMAAPQLRCMNDVGPPFGAIFNCSSGHMPHLLAWPSKAISQAGHSSCKRYDVTSLAAQCSVVGTTIYLENNDAHGCHALVLSDSVRISIGFRTVRCDILVVRFFFFLVIRLKAPAVRISRSNNPTVRQSSVYLYRTILQVKTLVQ